MASAELHVPVHPVRFVTAASLFDGHDAAINVMRRLLQSQGAEVVHLGHDRSVDAVVRAALEEDVQGVAISSYQGGHVEYFGYLVDRLQQVGAGHVRVFGGGGGVIVPEEIAALRERGVRIFSPEDGARLGLPGMINELVRTCDVDLATERPDVDALLTGDPRALARAITVLEAGADDELAARVREAAAARTVPVLGITGTGGSGKSSLTDELLRRLRRDQEDKLRVAVVAIDPSRRRGGGALLGDRIRMNALESGEGSHTFFRSMATRTAGAQVPEHLDDVLAAVRAAGFDLVVVETPGIGQGDAAIVPFSDVSLYVMTPEFGAASQLEKIDMLDLADVVAINKFERRGAEDARRDVARQMVRNREAFGQPWESMPVFGTSAARFDDDGVTALYQHLLGLLTGKGLPAGAGVLPRVDVRASTGLTSVVPSSRARYLADVADAVRAHHRVTEEQAALVRRRQHLTTAAEVLDGDAADAARAAAGAADSGLLPEVRSLLEEWPARVEQYSGDEYVYTVRGREVRTPLKRQTLSGTEVPRVALPRTQDEAELLRFLRRENLPGAFPYTAGVFPFKRAGEAPARMFAGEGDAFRTNRRFRVLSAGNEATRLSTAFDSVTLYGRDPDPRPDVYGKVGTSGVSIATLDDMRVLYDGFDLCSPTTSVSMTINGPAPAILAMFMNTAIEQRLDAFRADEGREPDEAEAEEIRAWVLSTVRGTVQADILKEDQGQNTCIFSTEFALRCMADIQEWFIEHRVRNFYSVSISGYHIAEAGANPISQLAFTLANGFTYVEAYLARGMAIDDFAPNLSFFFSNGMDAEYTVIGRVARRIWAVAMRDRYGANPRSQQLKYHVQTSGRSLHAQEMDFNDIRTTLQALCAIYDNANSLHTNAYDEAVTTPSEHSVRRALAIQMIIDREWGLAGNENPLQGSAVVDELTDLVEEAVLAEFDRIAERGGVLGAMETGYQRGKIQDESMLYEHRKHDGSLPIVGVNTFLDPHRDEAPPRTVELARATEAEKRSQLQRLADFQARHADEAPAALARLQEAATSGGNVFAALMDAVRSCSLGQISDAFFEVGGQYRRNV
ncbi:methylmalonyl-CoA mutase [Geodermatophilus bullaregiensis]|uniref:fused isobutyryl-CoA mutase/GTPase IcmF n=1 Tax=Geodermatophilus bullaregiensis TaxID=1564160 RepID=UPI001957F386|nr:fused isobutyryl-CoA mutase/GTPase IcmF [Geodermatophilus bullaregiensis]MBM7808862.1 methylmalonyl-CoA mutase [Geodermatophilus bullaregiensis]